ncbi:unnamed protein product [Didymodactylos carnosus]|uniref:Uncharacterized protein n=1 Tax=Didymodactylos carnosus TaxID=1234261 RepID=A0A814VNF8_9BILA|nr:unnamed protein product [Didymodactylos carnosus]CAF3955562.1 unnamed protein product [Didymodactylos carnosus]
MGVKVEDNDIYASHRLEKSKNRAIIVRFVRYSIKEYFYKYRTKLKSSELYKNVYVNEDITSHNHFIYMCTRAKLDKRYVFSKNGYVYYQSTSAIVGMVETWLSPFIDPYCLLIPNYQPVFRKDINRHGGGILLYARTDVNVKRLNEFENDNFEYLTNEVDEYFFSREIVRHNLHMPTTNEEQLNEEM